MTDSKDMVRNRKGRYSRHEILRQIGSDGQAKIRNSSVAIVGLGSLGGLAAELLVRAGIGTLKLIDHDVVEESNLTRQVLYAESDISRSKVEAAAKRLRKINCEVEIIPLKMHLCAENAGELDSDLILDCTDNLFTRMLINDYASREEIRWIYAGAIAAGGMILPIHADKSGNDACFQCVFADSEQTENCESSGILNSAASMISSVQVSLALRMLLDEEIEQRLIRVNAWDCSMEKYDVKRNPDCNACAGKYEYLENDADYLIGFCNSSKCYTVFPLKTMNLDREILKENYKVRSENFGQMELVLDGKEVLVHDYGEIVIKGEKNKDSARRLADKIYSSGRPPNL